ncbi:Histidine kinase [Actinacidiphila yanglinensis]|uniref:histidine kinase n=1 Tax=Actinacidiphila yanglinensis TaxID=310779 RepID=A0A1H6DFQ7_9ACTN|nr:histidine kinase [Actinacidiphila yanglinensis]SEG84198.1 Histidine kinase [Actinacidiphila yanglinensis]
MPDSLRPTRFRGLARPLARPVTYTRWLHLCVPAGAIALWGLFAPRELYLLAVMAVPAGLIPVVRLGEGLQAQALLVPDERGRPDATIAAATATTWQDRWRTVLWLEARLVLAGVAVMTTAWGPMLTIEMLRLGVGGAPVTVPALGVWQPHWWWTPLAAFPGGGSLVLLITLGHVVTRLARMLLGPSPAERLRLLEERTEQLLERNRIARELHDSIGHALTVAVLQAGAARAAGDLAFTERALAAIEEVGRSALDDLDRVLLILRESGRPAGARPTLGEADRLLEAARGSGSAVDAELSGPLGQLPGPISREGYRILQEALTNVLRHAGPVPIRVRVAMAGPQLELEVANPLPRPPSPAPGPGSRGGSGLRGLRERAALLGGEAQAGPVNGEWRMRVRLPLDGLAAPRESQQHPTGPSVG